MIGPIGFGFNAFNANTDKFKFIFCPCVKIGDNKLWLLRRPRSALRRRFKLKGDRFYVFGYKESLRFWFIITEDMVDPGESYIVSSYSMDAYILNVSPEELRSFRSAPQE